MRPYRGLQSVLACAAFGGVIGVVLDTGAAMANPLAAGSVDITTIYNGQPLAQSYSFAATRHSNNGQASGHWQIKQDYPGYDAMVHGRVTCLTVIGSTAFVGGVIERSTHPFYEPGGGVTWAVTDAGPGANVPDLASYMSYIFFADPKGFCGTGHPALPMTPIGRGNIQVRP